MNDDDAAPRGVDLAKLDSFINEPALHEQIIGSFCHDLRQPLQTALMRLAALKRADEHGQNSELLEDLYLSLREIATMSETVFDTIRLSRSTIASQPKAVALDVMLRRIEGDFRALASQRSLRLRVRATPLVAVTDETLVSRIVSNFVQNALNYTRTGGVLVAPRVRAGLLTIEVWDTGPGIAADQQERIFAPFARGASGEDTARSSGCAGLGLWNAREFARLLGGSVSVGSRVGRGSVFRLTLPGEFERRAVPGARGESPRGEGPVLLVSAQPSELVEMQRVVLRAGLTHVSFKDAIELLSYLNIGLSEPQFLLMDLDIGPVDVDFLFGILQSRFAHLPCVVLADDLDDVRVAALRLQGVTALKKPLAAAALTPFLHGHSPAPEPPNERRRERRSGRRSPGAAARNSPR